MILQVLPSRERLVAELTLARRAVAPVASAFELQRSLLRLVLTTSRWLANFVSARSGLSPDLI
jgi:hypothetical protein